MAGTTGSLAALEESFRGRVRATVAAAQTARVGDDPIWDAVLGALGIAPLSGEERLAIQRQGVPNLRGALPVEVRRALVEVGREAEGALATLVGKGDDDGDGGDDGGAERLRRELAQFVDREMRDYLDKARPMATVASIFANAQATALRLGDAKESVKTKKCPACGAARPEGTDLRACAFCGGDLFPRSDPLKETTLDARESIQRWDGFLGKIRERAVETLAQAEAGCGMLLDLNNLDPQPMTVAWGAIENQLRELGVRVETTFREKVEPALEAADDDGALVAVERRKGEAFARWLERERETAGTRIFAAAAHKIFAQARQTLGKEFRCTQCQAALPLSDRFFRSRHVPCAYCNNVNTFVPGTQVAAVEFFCCHYLASDKAKEPWFTWLAAEEAMRAGPTGDRALIAAAERALLAYTTAYLRARIEIVPEYEKDFDKDLKGRTAFFYEQVARDLASA